MKRLSYLVTGLALSVMSLPAFAQSAPDQAARPDNPAYGYGPMMWGYRGHWRDGWGWGPGGVFHGFAMALFIVFCVFALIAVIRWFSHGRYGLYGHHQGFHGRGSSALDILEERFARGEIDKSEFEEKRKLLRG